MFYIILYMYYIITQYVYTGYYDTVCECKHTTDRGMENKTVEQTIIDRQIDR